ncbi:hypothetical protein JCM10212_005741 [Sporobolomyces blumeae]
MVLVDGVKYACQSCIKGHRSSKCTHTNRPLVEIKKKGRPTSQCQHCREMRKTRSVHGKCDCAGREDQEKPVAKVLPNGIVDVLRQSEPPSASTSTEVLKSGVTRLLNPCNCKSGGTCDCCQVVSRASRKPFPDDSPLPMFVNEPPPPPRASCFDPVSTFDFSHDIPVYPVASTSSHVSPTATPLPQYSPTLYASSSSTSNAPQYSLPIPPSYFSSIPCHPPASSVSSYFTPSLPAVPPPPAPPPPTLPGFSTTTDSLFLPSTHGTSSCFCGPTCRCVGCAVHDPLGRRKRAGGTGGGGGGGGGGCRCGTDPDGTDECGAKRKRTGIGAGVGSGGQATKARCASEEERGGCCGSRTDEIEGPSDRGGGGGGGGGCCGAKKGDSSVAGDGTSTLDPSAFRLGSDDDPTNALSLPGFNWREGADRTRTSTATSTTSESTTTTTPLPSLRTLLPALSLVDDPVSRRSRTDTPPLLDQGFAPTVDCSSTFVRDVFDGSEECGSVCQCSSTCRCRGKGEASDEPGQGSAATGQGTDKADGRVQSDLDEIARLAASGFFG